LTYSQFFDAVLKQEDLAYFAEVDNAKVRANDAEPLAVDAKQNDPGPHESVENSSKTTKPNSKVKQSSKSHSTHKKKVETVEGSTKSAK